VPPRAPPSFPTRRSSDLGSGSPTASRGARARVNTLIVVPVFNEADTVGEVVAAARAYAPVLVVDDGSRDGSAEIARRAGADVSRDRKSTRLNSSHVAISY